MVLILCRVVESFCWLTRNIVAHISWHDLPKRKEILRFSENGNFSVPAAEIRDSKVSGPFCRYESPRTLVHLWLFLPHLRTRRCVLVGFSRHKFPCTLPILLTRCFECPQTFRCSWTLHSRRTCRSMRDQVRRRFRHCHNYRVSFLFLHPFRHGVKAAGRAEILRGAN